MLAASAATLLPGTSGALGQKLRGSGETTRHTCAVCRSSRVEAFVRNPHDAPDSEGLAARAGAGFSCAACHGNPTAHLEAGGGAPSTILAFGRGRSAQAIEGTCLPCHATNHPEFSQGPHGLASVSCLLCHNIHNSDVANSHLLFAPAGGMTGPQAK